jgi:catechol 2,3-dioxygenase-like lactoylglutathione lyase family enzyme
MIDHLSIDTANIAKARAFYDAALAALGYKRLSDGDTSIGYGEGAVAFWVLAVKHPIVANAGSGLHICFSAPNRESVDAFHAAALVAGGLDNGAPGLRTGYAPTHFAGFVIDPDGMRIEAYCGKDAY